MRVELRGGRNQREITVRTHKGQFKPNDPRSGKGGKREGAGRKSREEHEANETAQRRALNRLERAADRIVERYVARAVAKKSDKVLMHAVDKLIPDAAKKLEISGEIGIDDLLLKAAERKRASRNR